MEHLGKMLTSVFIAGPKTTVTMNYWELLSTSVSVKEVSCGTVCAGVRHCCLYNKFSGVLIGIRWGRGVLIGYRALIRFLQY